MSPALARALFWIAAVSCAVAHAALIRSVLRSPDASYPDDRRKGPRRGGMRWGPDRRSQSGDDGAARTSRELEIGWAVLPALALAGLLSATWLALPD